jgi:ketosteroid isomerase-like protein
MSTTFLRRGILLAAIVPALLTAGCAAGGTGQAMKGAASPPTSPPDTSTDTGTPTITDMTPTPTDTMSPSPTDTTSPTGGADMAEPRAVVEEFYSAMAAGNADEAVKLFTPDAVAAVDGEATAEGAEGLRSLIEGQEERGGSPTIEESTVAGNWAFVRATSGEGADETRAFFVLSKANGGWKIARYMSNSAS